MLRAYFNRLTVGHFKSTLKCGALARPDRQSKGHSMYAVIKTGGKQYRVAPGEKLRVETLAVEPGQEVVLSEVLAMGAGEAIEVGAPTIAGASVKAVVTAHGRGDKVRIFKHRRRKHYAKTQGHRQNYTEIEIKALVKADGSVLAAA
jgi:large subunit ribosomal protein L21